MNTKNINTLLSWSAAGLVLIIAIIGFALSYNALFNVALDNGYTFWLAVLWPFLIDFAIVVFSLGVVRAYVWREHSRWPWFLVGLFTIATIVFNLVHAGGEVVSINVFGYSVGMAYLVGVVPPVALFLSFETLMSMIKSVVARQGLIESIDSLRTTIHELRQQHGQAISDAELIKAELTESQAELDSVKRQIADKRKEFSDIGQTNVFIANADKLTKEERLPIVKDMILAGVKDSVIVESLSISDKTLGRYRTELNGQLNK